MTISNSLMTIKTEYPNLGIIVGSKATFSDNNLHRLASLQQYVEGWLQYEKETETLQTLFWEKETKEIMLPVYLTKNNVMFIHEDTFKYNELIRNKADLKRSVAISYGGLYTMVSLYKKAMEEKRFVEKEWKVLSTSIFKEIEMMNSEEVIVFYDFITQIKKHKTNFVEYFDMDVYKQASNLYNKIQNHPYFFHSSKHEIDWEKLTLEDLQTHAEIIFKTTKTDNEHIHINYEGKSWVFEAKTLRRMSHKNVKVLEITQKAADFMSAIQKIPSQCEETVQDIVACLQFRKEMDVIQETVQEFLLLTKKMYCFDDKKIEESEAIKQFMKIPYVYMNVEPVISWLTRIDFDYIEPAIFLEDKHDYYEQIKKEREEIEEKTKKWMTYITEKEKMFSKSFSYNIDKKTLFNVLHMIRDFNELYGITTFIDGLKGLDTPQMRRYGFMEHKDFGMLRSKSLAEIRSILYYLVNEKYIQKVGHQFPKLQFTEKGKKLYRFLNTSIYLSHEKENEKHSLLDTKVNVFFGTLLQDETVFRSWKQEFLNLHFKNEKLPFYRKVLEKMEHAPYTYNYLLIDWLQSNYSEMLTPIFSLYRKTKTNEGFLTVLNSIQNVQKGEEKAC